jgi:hypothetical protein
MLGKTINLPINLRDRSFDRLNTGSDMPDKILSDSLSVERGEFTEIDGLLSGKERFLAEAGAIPRTDGGRDPLPVLPVPVEAFGKLFQALGSLVDSGKHHRSSLCSASLRPSGDGGDAEKP